MQKRRDFLGLAVAATLAGIIDPPVRADGGFNGPLCLFSKHLPEMNWKRLAQAVRLLGFAGVDLTVRPGGHVLPERAAEDLPKAIATIRAEGLSVPMITTGLTSTGDATAAPILQTAGKLRIPYCKPGYWKYQFLDVRRELAEFAIEFRPLVELARQNGLQIGFHNHEGYLGAQLWDVANLIDTLDPSTAGYYFDVRHAVVEGGGAGWKAMFNLIAPRLMMIAIKDFYWDKTSKGWKIIDCPLGQGMVDWGTYFRLLSSAGFQGPVSLHMEYQIAGTTRTAREENTLVAAERDLGFLRAHLKEAYQAS